MFSERKLERLPPKTRLRKLLVIIRDEEQRVLDGGSPRLEDLLPLLHSRAFLDAVSRERRLEAVEERRALSAATVGPLAALNRMRHLILQELGVPWAEWDQLVPGATLRQRTERRTIPARVYLEDIRAPHNVGSIFRTAEAFGVEHVYLSPRTPLPTLARARRTSRGVSDAVPWSVCDLASLAEPASVGPQRLFALETGGTPIERFVFPEAGVVLIGSEELGLSPQALAAAEAGAGRVSIPMAGQRSSLNVAVAFGILMHAWHGHIAGR